MRRLSVIAGLVTLLGLLFAGAAHAATGSTTTAYTTTTDVRIPMKDGVTLDSDEYVPTSGCPCPTILVQTPYRKDGSAVQEGNPIFPAHGYAMIVVDVRGTGSSEGYWDSFGAKEQADGGDLVRYAASRPFSNGVVGLSGVSYSAINQFLTVEQPGTSAVKAIFPIVPMSDAYRDVTWAGGNEDSDFIPLWLALVTGLSAIPAQDAASQPQIALNAESQHLLDLAKFQAPVVGDSALGYYESMLPGEAQQYPDASYDGPFAQLRSPLRRIGLVTQPTFIVGGEFDIFQRGEPLLYQGLSLPAAKKKLMLGPWYHTTAGDGLPATDIRGRAVPSLDDLQLAWFDHWLKGSDNGITSFPDETWFQGIDKWVPGTYPWGATTQAWHLGQGGSLTLPTPAAGSTALPWTPVAGTCSRNTTQWSAGLISTGSCDSDESPGETQAATFTSAPFTSDYAVNGPLDLHLYVQSMRPDASLIANVTDVSPSGASYPITSGSLVLSLRQLTTRACGAVVVDCTQYANGRPIVPWHPYTRASQAPLDTSQGAVNTVDLEIFPTSVVIPAGHRLRVALFTADVPHEAPTLSTQADSAGNVLTILSGGNYPSYLYLETFRANFV